jgi:tRNA modification GTPase
MINMADQSCICAISTAPGMGAIAVIRVSGNGALSLVDDLFSGKLLQAKSHQALFGRILDDERTVDEVLCTVFKGPNSFTGEDTVEIACHGSNYIQQEILRLLLLKGCRMAEAGEFTLRAFLNGKMDLSQAEAVADLISSESEGSHALAMHQMRGGFSKEIGDLRERLIHFASLIELELDFGEEDVEFADRKDLVDLIDEIKLKLKNLIDSFAAGNVIKNGVPVAILGAPNRGKSTLLNVLLNEERAIVSAIAGTTRDTIEDEITIEGLRFRFIDTAGIRVTQDEIEHEGINRAIAKGKQAKLGIFLLDANTPEDWKNECQTFLEQMGEEGPQVLLLVNKVDQYTGEWPDLQAALDGVVGSFERISAGLLISALNKTNIDALKQTLIDLVALGDLNSSSTIVTNVRHYEALRLANESLNEVLTGLSKDITGDFLAIDIRRALHQLGSITGEITTDDLLGNIFGKFCIGK